ncbi:MAG: type IV pilus twitching motility protein PilT [bacterium]|nr:type IV pilus twitching motility protein PilT [bacterium]
MNIDINELLAEMGEKNASDLHLQEGTPPTYRIDGKLVPLDTPPLSAEQVHEIFESIAPTRLVEKFKNESAVDFAYSLPPYYRYRINAFHQKGTTVIAIRCLRNDILDFDQLKLPPVIKTLAEKRRGLMLMVGPTGSGKSTTLAAIVEYINQNFSRRIITIEDPIEFLYTSKKSVISQIEIGKDSPSFYDALKFSLRQDPDVILIGEMRDKETIYTAIHAAETGHLILSTLHTPDATQTIDRIMSFFPPEQHERIRLMLALNLIGVVAQRLVPLADGCGRVAAVEVLINTPIVTKLFREGKLKELYQAIQNKEAGMQTFTQALVELYLAKKITFEEGEANSDDPGAFRRMAKGAWATGDKTSIIF